MVELTDPDAGPPVFATAGELAQLRRVLADAAPNAPGALLLSGELARMRIVDGAASAGIVRLGSRVTYRDLATGRERAVRVATPATTDPDDNRVSVLSPIGSALIGLRQGAVFAWAGAQGVRRRIEVLGIDQDAA